MIHEPVRGPSARSASLRMTTVAHLVSLTLLASTSVASSLGERAAALARNRKSYMPAAGSVERKTIAVALHRPIERDLRQRVILKFTQLRVVGEWAVARVRPLQPNERSIDYRQTKYKEQVAEGMFDGAGEALLQRKHGIWTVVEWRFGATDTQMFAWIKKHGAPRALAE